MGLKQKVAAALAASQKADNLSLDASLEAENASDRLAELQQFVDEAPANAAEVLANSDILKKEWNAEVCVETRMLPRIAPDFQQYVRRELRNRLADAMATVTPVEYHRTEANVPYGHPLGGVAVYRATVVLTTREELQKLVETAFAAGACASRL